LRTPIREHVGKLDFKLSIAEFAYDTSVTRTASKSLHGIVDVLGLNNPQILSP